MFPEVSTATLLLELEPDPPKTDTVAFEAVGDHARRICGIAANTPNTVRTAMKRRRIVLIVPKQTGDKSVGSYISF
jgi:hypothetical protein